MRPLQAKAARGRFCGVDEFDVADAGGAARDALDRLHEPQQQVVLRPRPADGVGLGDDQVQHGDALEAVAHVEDQADRPRNLALALDGEQALRLGGPGDAYAQRIAVGDDLRRAVAVDRGDDAVAHAVLAPVEEQQCLELVMMLGRQARNECDLSCNASHSRSPTPARSRPGHLTWGFACCRDSHNSVETRKIEHSVWRGSNGQGGPVDTPGSPFSQVAGHMGFFELRHPAPHRKLDLCLVRHDAILSKIDAPVCHGRRCPCRGLFARVREPSEHRLLRHPARRRCPERSKTCRTKPMLNIDADVHAICSPARRVRTRTSATATARTRAAGATAHTPPRQRDRTHAALQQPGARPTARTSSCSPPIRC